MGTAQAKFRRGFKTEAAALAKEIRLELSLQPRDPLDPITLAAHLAVPLMPLTAMRDAAPEAVEHFCRVERGVFSAVTVFAGTERLIVYNDQHAPTRQASTIVHELSHALLLHPPHAALDAGTGCRVWNDEIENEANYLAGVLLVTDIAAVHIVRTAMPIEDAARTYGVSRQMITYRINVSGARTRASRL